MTLEKHSASSRGSANHGWLQAAYSFSFSRYYNPKRMQFGALRVLNDDVIAPNMGFGTHPHNDMEIITIPLKGVLKHKDSMSNEWLYVKPNDVQVMSAGTGIQHSEINGSSDEHLSLFQIWIIPNKNSVTPRYNQLSFNPDERRNKRQVLVSSIDDTEESGLKIHQEASISRLDLEANHTFDYALKGRHMGVYIMTISGEVKIETIGLTTRDALGISETENFNIEAIKDSELLMIEVPL